MARQICSKILRKILDIPDNFFSLCAPHERLQLRKSDTMGLLALSDLCQGFRIDFEFPRIQNAVFTLNYSKSEV